MIVTVLIVMLMMSVNSVVIMLMLVATPDNNVIDDCIDVNDDGNADCDNDGNYESIMVVIEKWGDCLFRVYSWFSPSRKS